MSFCCNECGGIAALLKSEDEEEADAAAARKKAEDEMKEIVKNVSFTKVSECLRFSATLFFDRRSSFCSAMALTNDYGQIPLKIWFQGEEKSSEKDKESSKDEKKSDKAEAPPDDGLTDEVRERKRLSLAAQQVRH